MSNKTAENGITTSSASWPIATILTMIFVVLKLTETIDWSWWWIFSPLWISALFSAFILFLIFIVLIIYFLVKGKK